MYRYHTQIDKESKVFKDNYSYNRHKVNEYRRTLKSIYKRDSDAVEKHKERGKLLVRERIELLLDPNVPFMELSPFAAYNQYDNQFPSAGIITGIGLVQGHETVIIANDATVKGGTYVHETIKKHLRAQEIAMRNRLPIVYMVDSGGVFLPSQDEVFPDKEHFGRIFYNQAKLSANSIPQIAIVMGSCTAGGAYIPAMSDETIIVKGQGTVFLAGPPLVEAATGEEVTPEELGGADVHAKISGVADHLANDDHHAIEICRNIFEGLTGKKGWDFERTASNEPQHDVNDIYGILPSNAKDSFDMYEIIIRLVDGSELHEFKREYGSTIITCFAKIMGYKVGIIANNGILFNESSLKATHFIELCNHRGIPLVFIQNVNGFIVGKMHEHKGIARDGAKFIHAVANASVPKFTIIAGGSFGAGNYAMAGRAYDPELLLLWPTARIGVMGGEQAGKVLSTVKIQQLQKKGEDLTDDKIRDIEDTIKKKYEEESSAYYSSSRLWDDGIIDPVDTRKYLALGIACASHQKKRKPVSGVYRM